MSLFYAILQRRINGCTRAIAAQQIFALTEIVETGKGERVVSRKICGEIVAQDYKEFRFQAACRVSE